MTRIEEVFTGFRGVFESLSPRLQTSFRDCPTVSDSPCDGSPSELRRRVTEMVVAWNISRPYIADLERGKRKRERTSEQWRREYEADQQSRQQYSEMCDGMLDHVQTKFEAFAHFRELREEANRLVSGEPGSKRARNDEALEIDPIEGDLAGEVVASRLANTRALQAQLSTASTAAEVTEKDCEPPTLEREAEGAAEGIAEAVAATEDGE